MSYVQPLCIEKKKLLYILIVTVQYDTIEFYKHTEKDINAKSFTIIKSTHHVIFIRQIENSLSCESVIISRNDFFYRIDLIRLDIPSKKINLIYKLRRKKEYNPFLRTLSYIYKEEEKNTHMHGRH